MPDHHHHPIRFHQYDPSILPKKMRYFIYYPPLNSIRLIDITENVRVEDILKLVKKEFGLNIQDSGPSETSIVLNYNGSDLKPKWSLADLSIPSGSIIRCLYREQKAADLYVHCGFNKQILKLFNSSITIETSISTIRKLISNQIGLPLSLFCLETYNGQERLYDQMNLRNYDLKIHDHVYLKIWRGYEKFVNSCIKGFTETYSHDDLTKHYQTQVALYVAAFYGHMELANYVMQQGARSDRPVGEHPSRQWSSETTIEAIPEALKCPIHIAVEQGHVKIVDLFVRHSILCTQVREPVSGLLPYELAEVRTLAAKSKEEKHRYRVIYLYLHDKQINLKIPLNSTGEYVSNLLTSTISANAVHRSSSHLVYVSLPVYCKLINWYEYSRERAWKKYGGRFYTSIQTKRIYPKHGLLGYKVLIDGYNNTFENPPEQNRNTRSDPNEIYTGFTDEEREKIIQMKTFVKQFALDDRKRAKQIAAINLKQSRRRPLILPTEHKKHSIQRSEGISPSSENSNSLPRSLTIISDIKTSKLILNTENTTNKKTDGKSNEQNKSSLKITLTSPSSSNEEEKLIFPIIRSSTLTNNENPKDLQPIMSSVDAYKLSSSRINDENNQQRIIKRRELFTDIKQSVDNQLNEQPEKSKKSLSVSFPTKRDSMDIETYIPLPDRPITQRSSPIKSRLDVDIRQAAVKPYERYASATTRSTAIHCLQEAAYFKGKSWLKQVEISKEMVKHHVKRRMRRADNQKNSKPKLIPLRTNVVT